ncbi:MAG TPA: GAF domain-containing protein [Anaeromyxobacteraceae bacterium]|nr:GAF domain-containing protein [Anaeromyxobacteraceae bacterium]
MPRFEVFIPAAPPGLPLDLTLRIDAAHWLAALKAGLEKIGGPDPTSHVLCDIQADGSIHVTDPGSGRVFRIQEMSDAARFAASVAAAPSAPAAAPRLDPPRAPSAEPAPPARSRRAPPPPEPPPPVLQRSAPAPSAASERVEQVAGPSVPPPPRIGRAPREPDPAELLAELFERVAELGGGTDRKAGLAFLLDLAIEKVDCEAGSVFLASLRSQDLEFAVVRGPRAEEIRRLGLKVPMGVGIVGFSAMENVSVAVSDAPRDPRFYRAVSEAVGYETRSILCAPIARQGRVLGALEVLNKRGDRPFAKTDLAVVAYLAHQAAELLQRTGG